MKTIAIIDASSASVTIKKLPVELYDAQCEEVCEHFGIDDNCEYVFGELSISIEL